MDTSKAFPGHPSYGFGACPPGAHSVLILLTILISILKVREDIGALALEAVSNVPTLTVSRGEVVLTFVLKNSAFARRGSPCSFGSSSSPFFPVPI